MGGLKTGTNAILNRKSYKKTALGSSPRYSVAVALLVALVPGEKWGNLLNVILSLGIAIAGRVLCQVEVILICASGRRTILVDGLYSKITLQNRHWYSRDFSSFIHTCMWKDVLDLVWVMRS